MSGADNSSRAFGWLWIASASIDGLVALVVSQSALFLLDEACRSGLLCVRPSFFVSAAAFVLVFCLQTIFVELVTAGRSLGRFVVGIRLHNAEAPEQPPAFHWRLMRLASMLTSLGFRRPALRSNGTGVSASAELLEGTIARRSSPPQGRISRSSQRRPQSKRPPVGGDAVLRVMSGNHSGTTIRLSAGVEFRTTGRFRIGRDPDWADLALVRDVSVSRQHCFVELTNGTVYVRDWGSGGKGSSNKTMVGSVHSAPNRPVALALGQTFRVGDTNISLSQS